MVEKISELEKVKGICLEENLKESRDNKKSFNPLYKVLSESFGPNTYSADCCRCNPQRC